MPLPVIAGLPWLAGILTSLFGGLVTLLAQFLTKRLALVVAGVVVLVSVTGAFMGAVYALVSGIAASAPSGLSAALGLFMPSNFAACVGAVLSAHVLRWAYTWQVKVVQYKLF